MGVGHTDESAQHFDSKKLSQIFLVLQTGFEPLIFGSRVNALLIEPPRHPDELGAVAATPDSPIPRVLTHSCTR